MKKRVLLSDFRIMTGLQNLEDRIISRCYRDYYTPIKWMVLKNGGTEKVAKELWLEVITDLIFAIKNDAFELPADIKLNSLLYTLAYVKYKHIKENFNHYLPLIDTNRCLTIKKPKFDEKTGKQFDSYSDSTKEILSLHYWYKIEEQSISKRTGNSIECIHSVIHNAKNDFGTENNIIKLLTYQYNLALLKERLSDIALPEDNEPEKQVENESFNKSSIQFTLEKSFCQKLKSLFRIKI